MKVRIIESRTPSGKSFVTYTESLDEPQDNLKHHDAVVISDSVKEIERGSLPPSYFDEHTGFLYRVLEIIE